MGNATSNTTNPYIDVICHHKSDGTVIPLRIRVKDEDGGNHVFQIRHYRHIPTSGASSLPNGVFVSELYLRYECVIAVFGKEKRIHLDYNKRECTWKLSYSM